MSAATGAPLLLPQNQRVTFDYAAVTDGQEIRTGELRLRALSTPGHTGESTCYLVADEALLTGDTLLVDSVGRPDLEGGDAGAEAGARALYHSLQERILALPDDVVIYPAHTAAGIGFDGVPVAARLGDVKSSLELLRVDEPTFVRKTLAALGPKPPSFQAIINLNEGKADLGGVDPVNLEVGPNRCAVG